MKRQLLLLLALLFCSIGTALAQKVIHGTVISKDDSEPIMGATVRVVGHNVGAATNLDGKFTINLPAGASKLSVSYVGMHTQEVEARDGMTVQMISSAKAIDEIIVVLPYKPNISLIHSILYNKLFAYIYKFLYLYIIILADIYA